MAPRLRIDDGCAVVFGSHVNAYSVVRELSELTSIPIVLVDAHRLLAAFSRLITEFIQTPNDPGSYLSVLTDLSRKYGRLVLFPTSDASLDTLVEISPQIRGFCFIPANVETYWQDSRKDHQYEACERLGVPYPRSQLIDENASWDDFEDSMFPLVIRPVARSEKVERGLRHLVVNSRPDLAAQWRRLRQQMADVGVPFLASEIIPGDDSNIYAYVAYRSPRGIIHNEWVGKKLSQTPKDFGVFSSASTEAPEEVRVLGRRLVEGMNLFGICEPEFKYDCRDGEYRLTEINLRSMMWNRAGHLAGVFLQYSQLLDAFSMDVPTFSQDRRRIWHFIYMQNELSNLLRRRGYAKVLWRNLTGGDHRRFAVFNWRDPMPMFADAVCFAGVLGSKALGFPRGRSPPVCSSR